MMRATLSLLVALLAVMAGCAPDSSRATVEFDEELENAITRVAAEGGSRRLKDLVPGDWTSVRVLVGPISGARIERELGRPVEVNGAGTHGGDYVQDGNLLVFEQDTKVQRMISLGQLAALGTGDYPADVVLKGQDGAIVMLGPYGNRLGG